MRYTYHATPYPVIPYSCRLLSPPSQHHLQTTNNGGGVQWRLCWEWRWSKKERNEKKEVEKVCPSVSSTWETMQPQLHVSRGRYAHYGWSSTLTSCCGVMCILDSLIQHFSYFLSLSNPNHSDIFERQNEQQNLFLFLLLKKLIIHLFLVLSLLLISIQKELDAIIKVGLDLCYNVQKLTDRAQTSNRSVQLKSINEHWNLIVIWFGSIWPSLRGVNYSNCII